MSAPDDDSEKPFEPTQKKLDEARKKGEIAKSNDVSVAASYGGLLLALLTAGALSMESLGEALMVLIDQSTDLAPLVFNGSPSTVIGGVAYASARAVMPIFLLPAIAVVLSLIAQRAFIFAPSKLALKASRINPIKNAANKFGRGGLFEFAKSFTKLLIYSTCLAFFLNSRLDLIAGVMQSNAFIATGVLARLCIEFLFLVLIVASSIGGIDYLWQRKEHMRKNMMSRKDLTDEAKDSEGDPHMKQKRRQRAQEIALSQMIQDVPDADVIIVNPTHYAVALKWSRLPGEAPVCVAKGVDEVAKTIRKVAQEAGVPIRSDPPVARALHATVEIGQEIPPEHYRAIAAAIRFAEAMKKRAWKT